MLKSILSILCLFSCGTVCAEGVALPFNLLQEIAGAQSVRVENPNVPGKVSYFPQDIYWGHSSEELYDDGGMQFEYAGEKYSVKLGFERGAYDPYINNYRTIPVIILSETKRVYPAYKVTDLQSGIKWINLNQPGEMGISGNAKSMFFRNASGDNVAVFDYAVLRDTWEQNALRYVKNDCGTTTKYFIPQTQWKEGLFHYGYVVSEHGPYYPNSGLPLDFVELYRYRSANEEYSYKPISYSIPLGIVFKVASNGKGRYWILDELRPTDLQDALADELRNRPFWGAQMRDDGGAVALK